MIKSYIFRIFTFVFVLFAMLGPSMSSAVEEGGKEGHGGDAYSQEFFAAAVNAINQLKAQSTQAAAEAAPLEAEMNVMRVTSQEVIDVGGVEVNAVPSPDQNVLVISRKYWDTLTTSQAQMDFAIKELQAMTPSAAAGVSLSQQLNAAQDAAAATRKTLRQTGLDLMSAYIDIGRTALTINHSEMDAELLKIGQGDNYQGCFGNIWFPQFRQPPDCKGYVKELENVPTFARIDAGLSGPADVNLTNYLKTLPQDGIEANAFLGWGMRVMISYDSNSQAMLDLARASSNVPNQCTSNGLFSDPDPKCLVSVFEQALSGVIGAEIGTAAQNYDTDMAAVEKEMQAFVSE